MRKKIVAYVLSVCMVAGYVSVDVLAMDKPMDSAVQIMIQEVSVSEQSEPLTEEVVTMVEELPTTVGVYVDENAFRMGDNEGILCTFDAARNTLIISGEDMVTSWWDRDPDPILGNSGKSLLTCGMERFVEVEHILVKDFILSGTAEGMFCGMNKVIDIQFENTDFSKVTSMNSFFDGCESLTRLDLSEIDTSSVTDMGGMFRDCENLERLDLNGFDTSKVTDMSQLFFRCLELESINITTWDTGSVKNMENMFRYCGNLQTLSIDNFDTKSLNNMSGMFLGCSQLQRIDFPYFDIERVVRMDNLFSGCENLVEVNFAPFSAINATSMEGMFQDCKSLKSLDLSFFLTEKVSSMEDMFRNCSSLENLDLSHFRTPNLSRVAGMFAGCEGLKKLDISNFSLEKVRNFQAMFSGCILLSEIDFSNIKAGTSSGGVMELKEMFQNCRHLKKVDFSGFTFGNVVGFESCFKGCVSLDTIMISADFPGTTDDLTKDLSSFTEEKQEDGGYLLTRSVLPDERYVYHFGDNLGISASYDPETFTMTITGKDSFSSENPANTWISFYQTNNFYVEHVLVKNFVPSGSLSCMFYNQVDVQDIIFEQVDTKDVTAMDSLFWQMGDNDKLTSLKLGTLDMTNVTTMAGMFGLCGELKELDVTFLNTDKVTDMSFLCKGCEKLTEFDVSSLDTKSVTNMSSMFEQCGVTNLDISHFDTSNVTDMSYMFRQCGATNLDVSHFDTSKVTSMRYMFEGFTGKTLDVGNFDTRNVKYLSYMFCNSDLEELNLSSFVLEDIYFEFDEVESSQLHLIDGCNQLRTFITPEFHSEYGYFFLPSQVKSTDIFEYCRQLRKQQESNIADDEVPVIAVTISEWCDATGKLYEDHVKYIYFDPLNHFYVSGPIIPGDTPAGTKLTYKEWELPYEEEEECIILEPDNLYNSMSVNGVYHSATKTLTLSGNCNAIYFSNFDFSLDDDPHGMRRSFWPPDMEVKHLILKDLTIEEFKYIGSDGEICFGEQDRVDYLFADQNIYTVTFDHVEFPNVKSMKGLFLGCPNLQYVDMSGLKLNCVEDMSGLFKDCPSLTKIRFGELNTRSVTNMSYMFQNASRLVTVDLENLDTSSVTDMRAMFEGCKELKNLDFSGFHTANVVYMDKIFEMDNSKLKKLDLSKFDLSKLEENQFNISVHKLEELHTPEKMGENLSICLSDVMMDEQGQKITSFGKEYENQILTKWIPPKDVHITIEALYEDGNKIIVSDSSESIAGIVSEDGELSATADFAVGETISLKAREIPGYVFLYWYWSFGPGGLFSSIIDEPICSTSMSRSGEYTIQVFYTKTNTVTLKLGDMVWKSLSVNPDTGFVTYEEDPSSELNPGYRFMYWYEEGYEDNPVDLKTKKINEDLVLYAKWEDLPTLQSPTVNILNESKLLEGAKLELTAPVAGASVYYTLDGTIPDEKSILYQTPVVLSLGQHTLKAIAKAKDYKDSPVTEISFLVLSYEEMCGEVLPEDIPVDGILPKGVWTSKVSDMIYTGQAIKPEVRVYDENKRLTLGTDYKVTYLNNTKASAASSKKPPMVQITGIGNYQDVIKIPFSIHPLDLETNINEISMSPIYAVENGKVQKPIPILYYEGKKLINKADMTVSYPDGGTGAYKKAGNYVIQVTGKGSFTGTLTIPFEIQTGKRLITGASFKAIPAISYTGEEIKPSIEVSYRISGKNIPLVQGTDFEVSYENNVQVGKATARVKGIGEYTGEKVLSFSIKGISLSNAKVTNLGTRFTYTGTDIEPAGTNEPDGKKVVLTVKVNGVQTQVPSDCYDIEYRNNVKKGTGSVTFIGKNGYTGKIKKNFTISQYDISKTGDLENKIQLNIEDYEGKAVPYSEAGVKMPISVIFNGTVLKVGTDYKVTYQKKRDPSDAGRELLTVTVTGTGNFKGKRTVTYSVMPRVLSECITASDNNAVKDKLYTNKNYNYRYIPQLWENDLASGKLVALKAGKDYVASKYEILEKGENGEEVYRELGAEVAPVGSTIRVTLVGKSAKYTGTVTDTYRVVSKNINSAKVTLLKKQVYDGTRKQPDYEDLRITYGKGKTQILLTDDDYEIVSYGENINVGKGTVVIKGKGTYGFMRTITFSIQRRSVK